MMDKIKGRTLYFISLSLIALSLLPYYRQSMLIFAVGLLMYSMVKFFAEEIRRENEVR